MPMTSDGRVHQSPSSFLPLYLHLQQHTRLAVHQATDGIRIQPDHVYVTPSDKNLHVSQRILILIEKPERPYVPHSIDVVSPRSITVYLNRESQKKLVSLIYRVPNPGGILFLGFPDTIHEFTSLFGTLDQKWKICERR